jgi:hypothetical protein
MVEGPELMYNQLRKFITVVVSFLPSLVSLTHLLTCVVCRMN